MAFLKCRAMSASLAPDAAKEVRAMLTCPIGAASSSDLTGALCPRIATNPRMTCRAVANCCQWVRRIFTIQNGLQASPDVSLRTSAELAVYLYQQTGIEVQRSAMQDCCHRHDLRPYRPIYRYLRGDPDQQQAARNELEALKKKPK